MKESSFYVGILFVVEYETYYRLTQTIQPTDSLTDKETNKQINYQTEAIQTDQFKNLLEINFIPTYD